MFLQISEGQRSRYNYWRREKSESRYVLQTFLLGHREEREEKKKKNNGCSWVSTTVIVSKKTTFTFVFLTAVPLFTSLCSSTPADDLRAYHAFALGISLVRVTCSDDHCLLERCAFHSWSFDGELHSGLAA